MADASYGFVMGWATTGHTAAAVPLTAQGPGAEGFAGVLENTDVFHVLVDAMNLSQAPARAERDVAAVGDD